MFCAAAGRSKSVVGCHASAASFVVAGEARLSHGATVLRRHGAGHLKCRRFNAASPRNTYHHRISRWAAGYYRRQREYLSAMLHGDYNGHTPLLDSRRVFLAGFISFDFALMP